MQKDHLPAVIWEPSEAVRQHSNLTHYMDWLCGVYGLSFPDYPSLWQWSVDDSDAFWGSLWVYFGIQSDQQPTAVLESEVMPGAKWFTSTQLNYAEHVFLAASADRPAILFKSEGQQVMEEISWDLLRTRVAAVAAWLKERGIGPGDRVVAYIQGIPEATIAFLACNAVGAIWSSCSPDFGAASVVDRFQQIAPRVLIASEGYVYGGKSYDRVDVITALSAALPTLEHIVWIPTLGGVDMPQVSQPCSIWAEVEAASHAELTFTRMPFEHPIWILYSSGTTGMPKAITHGQGGVLLEHLKYLTFHNDVHPGERYFWYSTTGWMMWNFLHGALLAGATMVLYDGSPGYPDLGALWAFASAAQIQHFGTSAPFLVACMKADLRPAEKWDLSALRSIGSTGSPLPPEAFAYVHTHIKASVWLCSMSGGTDVCTAFVGGCPLLPVYEGEIQCRALGCALFALDVAGNILEDEVGEMVILKPMPSMPVYFWNDPDASRYSESYFDTYPGLWRHGDWVRVTPRGSLVIYGRSDATLNRQGIRIGTAEIYRTLDKLPELLDSLIVNLELPGGRHYMPLFVVLAPGQMLDTALQQKINERLRETYSPRHVPDAILAIPEVPYTISGKKMETPVKKILMGKTVGEAASLDAMRNPESLQYFVALSARKQTQVDGK